MTRKRVHEPVTEVIPICPHCGKPGQVVYLQNEVVTMYCADCRHEWKSLTEECPVCGKSNGYVVKGTCAKCYAKKKGVA